MNQQEYIGFDSISYLATILLKLSPKNIFLVTGRQSFEVSGAKNILDPLLKGFSIVPYPYNEPNPKIADIERGLETYKKEKPDVVIAVGGGSVIDTAKLINFFAANDIKPKDWFNEKKPEIRKSAPLIAIPTTSGSGSEATHFAVLYIGKEKHSVEHETMLPAIAIIDQAFSMNLPPYITASSGMDALSQAIESYWSIHATEQSKKLAASAIELIYPGIIDCVNNPTPEHRLSMAQGAHLAGKAIRLTKTTAVHAISYPMTSYFGIPHGHACGLILPGMFHFISGVTENSLTDKRGREYVIKTLKEIAVFLGEKNHKNAPKRLEMLMKEIGLETNLNALGIKSNDDIETIITHGFNPDRVKNNPRYLNKSALRHILNKAAAMSAFANPQS
ncbi:MAG: phosphonoacetaldehyde reductase [Deltaproteobacteria bacterium]|nr:phosphonoacetaldehyde reductase [Deltaproteobacteria bacterium]